MISRSIIQFLAVYIFYECHYFVFNFIVILRQLQVTGYEGSITLLYDYIF